ncbi:MAG: hypothetical protein RLZ35_334 [Pseudomonadota bacterium]
MSFEENITHLYGHPGQTWIARLPEIIRHLSNIWGLSELKPVKKMTYHYILSGFQGKKPIILKLGFDQKSLNREVEVLNAFCGFGCVKVLAVTGGAALLECATPGTSLTSLFPDQDAEAVHILATAIKRLHQAPVPQSKIFPTVADWLRALDQDWDIPTAQLKKARGLRDELLASAEPSVLLHGDLHHGNLLQQNDGWLVIDPKGVIGEPAYEIAAFIRNPIPNLLDIPDPSYIIERRIRDFSKLMGFEENHIRNWCFVQSILSWAWALEDRSQDIDCFKKVSAYFL